MSPLPDPAIARAFVRHNAAFPWAAALRESPWIPPRPVEVPAGFLGLCVAAGPDPASDDYTLERLRDLGVRCVRMDISYEGLGGWTERLLARLIGDGCRVCLHPLQPHAEAARMPSADSLERWRNFVRTILERYGREIELIEFGATCNRKNWSGYRSLAHFLPAWRAAWEETRRHNVTLAGPNVTDFEPVYNVALLGILKREGMLPDIHTDNLFVERATEPEAFDHKILGRRAAPAIRFNLVRKALLLDAIARRFGIGRTVCTHVAWSLRRIGRLLADREEKQADYVFRYCALAAASGALQRVYWGPLIGQREGLIDDGTSDYPDLPRATYYGRLYGDPSLYRLRPAYHAFRTIARVLPESSFHRSHTSSAGLEIHEFRSGGRVVHAVWTANGRLADARKCYEAGLDRAECRDRSGALLPHPPATFTERPVLLSWANGSEVAPRAGAAVLEHVRVATRPDVTYAIHESEGWRGIQAIPHGRAQPLVPEALEQPASRTILRDSRNCVWAMPDPTDPARRLVVKRHRTTALHKRWINRWRVSRALASWNGANELLRRGIPTPLPVACFFRPDNPVADSYYLCEAFPGTGSVRRAFVAFRNSAGSYEGVNADAFYRALAALLSRMHNRGVFFRDLSAGNVLVRAGPADGPPEFSLIDTARARFLVPPLALRQRLSDLKRIVHPLDWRGREAFLAICLDADKRRLTWWMRLPIAAYDAKHRIKNFLRDRRNRA